MSNLNVTYGDIQQAATRLANGREELESKLQELRAFIESLVSSGFVTDQASVRFNETYQQFTTNATGTISALNGLSDYLNHAAQTLQDTDNQLAGQIG